MAGTTEAAPRRAARWRAVALASVALHLWGLYAPDPPPVPAGWAWPGLDKAAHVLLFALPVLAWAPVVRSLGPVVAALAAHAPLSEWIQATALARRAGDPLDLLADLAGIGLGWLACRWWARGGTWRQSGAARRRPPLR